MKTLAGKVALVTGASRGIGASTALEMAREGASVVLAARSLAQCEAIAAQIIAAGGTARAIACDVADYLQMEEAVQCCHDTYGSLDCLVNNAGVIEPIGLLAQSDPDQWIRATEINYRGIYNGLRTALPGMIRHGGGTIINISSGAAHHALEGWSHYCSAKAAAAMLTQCTHLEYGAQGVRTFGLSPGTVATEMQVLIRASGINPVSQLDPGVHIDPSWPAKAVVWLCTPDADPQLGKEISLRDGTIQAAIGLST